MNICAIICEYNPFHEGHRFQIETARRETDASHIVCIMSGNYVQRGDVAVYDKWHRAECAIKGGADLVIELPTPYVLTSAEFFAKSGVYLAKQIGAKTLSFGSECGDIEALKKVASSLALPDTQEKIRLFLSDGLSYPSAVAKATENSLLDEPNNLLGIEYIKADPTLNFHTVKRTFAHDEGIGCASDIRKKIYSGEIKSDSTPHFTEYADKSILATLRKMTVDELAEISGCSEGLENRLKNALTDSCNIETLCEMTKSKRYPLSRIRRYVMCAFLGIKKGFPENPPYARILAFNDKGREVISYAQDIAEIPIITKVSDGISQVFNTECTATDLYTLFSKDVSPCGLEFKNSPIYVKKDR